MPVLTPQRLGQSWDTIQITPAMPQSQYSKRKPAEHEARQTEAVRRLEARVLRDYARWRKNPTSANKHRLTESIAVKERAIELEYKNRKLRYKAPETFQGKRQAAAKRRKKVDAEAQAKALYGAARQENATFKQRARELVAIERFHRGELSASELERERKRTKRAQHADWLRLLRREGLTRYAKSVPVPAK